MLYGSIVNAIALDSATTLILGKQEGDSIFDDSVSSSRYDISDEIAQHAVIMVSNLSDLIEGDYSYMSGGTIILHH